MTPRADAPVRLVEERVSVEIAAADPGEGVRGPGEGVPAPGQGVLGPGAVLHHLLYTARVAAHFRLIAEREVGLDVGFPVDPAWASELEVRVDGRKQEWTWSGDGKWAVWRMEFRPGTAVDLSVRYQELFGLESPGSPLRFSYVLSTGAAWQGPIGRVRLEVATSGSVTKDDVLYALPEGYRLVDGKLVWDMRHVEPSEDVHISLRNVVLREDVARARTVLRSAAGTALGQQEVRLLRLVGMLAGQAERDPQAEWLSFLGVRPADLDALYHAGERVLWDARAGGDAALNLHYLGYVLTRPALLARDREVLVRAFRAAEAYLTTTGERDYGWLQCILRQLGGLAARLYDNGGDAESRLLAARVLCLAVVRQFFDVGDGSVQVEDRVLPIRGDGGGTGGRGGAAGTGGTGAPGGAAGSVEQWPGDRPGSPGRARLSPRYGWVGQERGFPVGTEMAVPGLATGAGCPVRLVE
ncbi:MAG: hypothetical protein AB1816_13715, partial [Bacillota bacterium]